MRITSFSELQNYIGKTVFANRGYAGWVEFEVTHCQNNKIEFQSKPVLEDGCGAFDFSFAGYSAIEAFHDYSYHYPLITIRAESHLYDTSPNAQKINTFVEQYGKNKDDFSKEMIKRVYKKEMDPDHGDYDMAQMVKAMAEMHYYDLDLD